MFYSRLQNDLLSDYYMKKNDLAELSILLEIASSAAKTSVNVDEAIGKIPRIHTSAIPDGIMASLVTCIATISKDKSRRCLRAKVKGSDYCTIHKNPYNSISKNECIVVSSSKSSVHFEKGLAQRKQGKTFKSLSQLKVDAHDFFRKVSPHANNDLKWNIQCIEDAFLSERNVPFALGLHIRRFFPGYGKLA